jgi:hypothetical protein
MGDQFLMVTFVEKLENMGVSIMGGRSETSKKYIV